jgi:hypothetical protein
MQNETPDERTIMLKAAIAATFKAREAVNIANVRAKLPADFFLDFDTGAPLDDATVFAEIQATYSAAPKAAPMIEDRPDHQGKLATLTVEQEENPAFDAAGIILSAPDTVSEPLPQIAASEQVEAEPVEQRTAELVPSGQPGAQARLDAARKRESDLIYERQSLSNAQRAARSAVALAVQEYQRSDPNRVTPAENSAQYRASSQAERKARVEREGGGQPRIAYVDAERKYSRGTDANSFARRNNRFGNSRGAFSKTALGTINRDETRGSVPAPVTPPRPTIPALAK